MGGLALYKFQVTKYSRGSSGSPHISQKIECANYVRNIILLYRYIICINNINYNIYIYV